MPTLYPYQENAVKQVLAEPHHRGILNFDLGLGKSATAIEIAKTLYQENQTIVIVCPALVQRAWVDQLNLWWSNHPDIGLIREGRQNKSVSKKKAIARDLAYAAPIQIISYNLLQNIELLPDILILDELHRVKNPSTTVSHTVRLLAHAVPAHGAVIGLTGTLIPDVADDLWHQIHTVYPNRWGKLSQTKKVNWAWMRQYCLMEHNGYGYKVLGVREDKREALQAELSKLAIRVTRADAAPWLPVFTVNKLQVSPGDRLDAVINWAEEHINAGIGHICIATHEKSYAKDIADLLHVSNPEYTVECITGEVDPVRRYEVMARLKAAKKAILVCTYHSMNEGISLTEYEAVLVPQLDWQHKTIIQFFWRFSRLSSTVPSKVDLLVKEATGDGRMASALLRKVEDMNALMRPGHGEAAIELTLGIKEDDMLSAWATVEEKVLNDLDNLDLDEEHDT